MTQQMLNIGWIGCGNHAQAMLLPQLSRYPVKLAALCDTDAQHLAVTASRYGVNHTYLDYRQLLQQPGLDAVGMAVGPSQHVELACAALNLGLPVFMEKPPGCNAADAIRIQAAAQASGQPVVLGFMKRFASGYRIAQNLLREEKFGPLLSFYGQYMTAPTYFSADPDYSGFYLHHCVHYMDMLHYLVGPVTALQVRKVEAAAGKLLLHIAVEFNSGAIGTLIMGTVQARSTPMEFIQLMGDQQRIEIDNIVKVHYYRAPDFKSSELQASLHESQDTLTWQPNWTVAADEDHKGYHALLGQFVALLQGKECDPDTPTIAAGVAAMQLLDTLVQAVENA